MTRFKIMKMQLLPDGMTVGVILGDGAVGYQQSVAADSLSAEYLNRLLDDITANAAKVEDLSKQFLSNILSFPSGTPLVSLPGAH